MPGALYQEKAERIRKAVNLESVDRVPVVYAGTAFSPRFIGMSIAEYCADLEAPLKVTLAAMDSLGGFDGINSAAVGRITALLPSMWLSRVKVPGRDLPPDSLWQIMEAEVMTHEDYDFIIDKGWMTFLNQYLPRISNVVEFQEARAWMGANMTRCLDEYRNHGYVPICVSACAPPFEALCGGRSMSKFLSDLYRIPEKVQAAMDVMLPEMIKYTIRSAPPGVSGVWVGGWRTASALMSPRLSDRFVWPYIAKMVEALVGAGLMPVLHWDQNWTRDLIRLQELPAKKCLLNPDGMTDMRQFKRLVGDRMAMMGDVPAPLFSIGTPADIDRYVRDLVQLFEGKGLILAPGCDAPINTKPENMKAFVAAAYKYGGLKG
jgi:uroporphyrinogen-III decarboxylase